MNNTILGLAVGAVLAGILGYFIRPQSATLLYFGLMAVGAAALGFVIVKAQPSMSA